MYCQTLGKGFKKLLLSSFFNVNAAATFKTRKKRKESALDYVKQYIHILSARSAYMNSSSVLTSRREVMISFFSFFFLLVSSTGNLTADAAFKEG